MLVVSHLSKVFAGHDETPVNAMDDVSFVVEEGQIFTLLGPSGCGKTTTLRSIAGLERPDSGEIEISGDLVFSGQRGVLEPVHARDIGMVFQSYAIWPHMTVFDNVAFPLKVARKRPSRREIERRVTEALHLVKLGELAGRDATKLSGGQQQRLSLARALVRRPKLLLLDEPLSNLDANLREQMRFELKRLQRDIGVTCLYVTHDQFEALALSDRIAVLRNGRVQQIGQPREIYETPANDFVATFVGSTNLLEADVLDTDNEPGGRMVATPLGRLRCEAGTLDPPVKKAVVAIRQENIAVTGERPAAAENVFEARVVEAAYLGEGRDLILDAGGQPIRVRTGANSVVTVGHTAWVELPARCCVLLPRGEAASGARQNGAGARRAGEPG